MYSSRKQIGPTTRQASVQRSATTAERPQPGQGFIDRRATSRAEQILQGKMAGGALHQSGQPLQINENAVQRREEAVQTSGNAFQANENTIQRKVIGTLGGYSVNDTAYVNGAWDTIRPHLAGEWNGNNGSSPTGGHILNEMVAKWGPSHANVARVNDGTTNASGVYFTGSAPAANKVAGTTFDYFLVDYSVPSQKKMSSVKTSSFWPVGWSNANLKTVLDNSQTTTTGNTNASKAITNYWFTWHSLGDVTAYPLARYSEMS